MKKLTLLAFFLLFPLAGQTLAQVTIEAGPRIGYEIDGAQQVHVGLDARLGLGFPVKINPFGDFYFGNDFSAIHAGANAIYEFGFENQVFTPYTGIGAGLLRTSFNDVSSIDPTLNVIGGAVFGFGTLRPFGQAQIALGGGDLVTMTAGVLVLLGQK